MALQAGAQLVRRGRDRIGEACEPLRGRQSPPGLVVVGGQQVGVGLSVAAGEHHRDPAVEVVAQHTDGGETDRAERGSQRREGEIAVVAVTQRGPGALRDDVAERLDEENGQTVAGQRLGVAGENGGEVAFVHQPEAVDHQICGAVGWGQVEQRQPAAAVRGTELDDRGPTGEVTEPSQVRDRLAGLVDDRLRLRYRNFRFGGVVGVELRQPAAATQPHGQRVGGVGERVGGQWPVTRRRLGAEVEHDHAVAGAAQDALSHGRSPASA